MATYYKLKIEDRLQIGSSSSRSIRRMGKIPINYYYKGEKNKNFLIKILIGTLPIIPIGYIFYQTGIINQLRNLDVIGWMSLIFGILLYTLNKRLNLVCLPSRKQLKQLSTFIQFINNNYVL